MYGDGISDQKMRFQGTKTTYVHVYCARRMRRLRRCVLGSVNAALSGIRYQSAAVGKDDIVVKLYDNNNGQNLAPITHTVHRHW